MRKLGRAGGPIGKRNLSPKRVPLPEKILLLHPTGIFTKNLVKVLFSRRSLASFPAELVLTKPAINLQKRLRARQSFGHCTLPQQQLRAATLRKAAPLS
ncbi:MAG TPA: hypothetical protein VF646_06540 [Cytophagales bacterium]